MNNSSNPLKLLVVGLGLAVVVLAILLANTRKQAAEQAQSASALSNQIQQATVILTGQQESITNLGTTLTNLVTDLTARRADILALSNTLAMTMTNLDQTQASLKTAQETITKLEAHNQALEARATELNGVIASLTSKIEDITGKLTAAEGDKIALTAELKRLTAEKAELERRFNDLNALKAQVKKIKSDAAVGKRLNWSRSGIQTTEPKAAEKTTGTGAAARQAHYDLNVEVGTDGTLKIIPPLNTGSNKQQ